jgi:hypothetical protein
LNINAFTDALAEMVEDELIRGLTERSLKRPWTLQDVREVLRDVLRTARSEWDATEQPPRVLCLVSVEGGQLSLRARVETVEKTPARGPGKVVPIKRRGG